jgi:hypothetical protein
MPVELRPVDKTSRRFAYEYDPIISIILPPKRPCRLYRTTTQPLLLYL